MTISKKFFAALTAAFTAAILIMPTAFAASTMEKSLTPAENPPFTILMGINYNDESMWEQKDDNFRTFSADISDAVSYTFDSLKPSNQVGTLVLDTNIKSSSYPDAQISVTGLSIVKAADGSVVPLQCDSAKLSQSLNANGCIRMNILHNFTQPPVKAYDGSLPNDLAKGDKIVIGFEIKGIGSNAGGAVTTTTGGSLTTTTAATTTNYVGTTSIYTQTSIVRADSNSVGTVAQTADTGVIVLIATGGAAASLAAVAFTMKKRRK